MKHLFNFLFFASLFLVVSCRAQMVQTITDAKKLEINEKQFIGKPLRNLFNEIRPQIKRALVSAGGGETNSFFDFYFVTYQEASTLRNSGKRPVTIRVYTNEIINWDASNKPRGDRWKWDENDIKKYGNLTIKAIRVDGEY